MSPSAPLPVPPPLGSSVGTRLMPGFCDFAAQSGSLQGGRFPRSPHRVPLGLGSCCCQLGPSGTGCFGAEQGCVRRAGAAAAREGFPSCTFPFLYTLPRRGSQRSGRNQGLSLRQPLRSVCRDGPGCGASRGDGGSVATMAPRPGPRHRHRSRPVLQRRGIFKKQQKNPTKQKTPNQTDKKKKSQPQTCF